MYSYLLISIALSCSRIYCTELVPFQLNFHILFLLSVSTLIKHQITVYCPNDPGLICNESNFLYYLNPRLNVCLSYDQSIFYQGSDMTLMLHSHGRSRFSKPQSHCKVLLDLDELYAVSALFRRCTGLVFFTQIMSNGWIFFSFMDLNATPYGRILLLKMSDLQ